MFPWHPGLGVTELSGCKDMNANRLVPYTGRCFECEGEWVDPQPDARRRAACRYLARKQRDRIWGSIYTFLPPDLHYLSADTGSTLPNGLSQILRKARDNAAEHSKSAAASDKAEDDYEKTSDADEPRGFIAPGSDTCVAISCTVNFGLPREWYNANPSTRYRALPVRCDNLSPDRQLPYRERPNTAKRSLRCNLV